MEKMWWDLARIFADLGHETTSISRRWRGWPDEGFRDGVRCLRLPGHNHTSRLWLNLVLDARWGIRVMRSLPTADILVTNTILLPALASRFKTSAGHVVVSLNRMPKGQLRTYARVARIQTPSSAVLEAVRTQAPALLDRIKIVPNTISHEQLSSARQESECTNTSKQMRLVRLGYIGRIHPEKGLTLLVEAARRLSARKELPPWRLEIRGPLDVARGGAVIILRAYYRPSLRSFSRKISFLWHRLISTQNHSRAPTRLWISSFIPAWRPPERRLACP